MARRSAEEFIFSVRDLISSDDGKIIKELYSFLNILDSKTSSLLRFNALVVAIFSLGVGDAGPPSQIAAWGLWVGVVLVVVSTFVGFSIVRIDWPFLHAKRALADEAPAVARVVDRRTLLYQVAWWLSLLGIIFLLIGTMILYGCK